MAPVLVQTPISAADQMQRFAPRSQVAGLATRGVIVDIPQFCNERTHFLTQKAAHRGSAAPLRNKPGSLGWTATAHASTRYEIEGSGCT
jgi:hypothetical protein